MSTPLRNIFRIEDQYGGTSRTGKAGTPLVVALRVVEAGSCAPIGGALVDIWHTHAAGSVFGVPGVERGWGGHDGGDVPARDTGDGRDGLVEFETVYPGWYSARTAYIHFRVYMEEGGFVSSQLYFPG